MEAGFGGNVMSIFDFSHLTTEQKLELIGDLWRSLETQDIPVSPAQMAELDRRLARLDEDIADSQDADAVFDELMRRYR